ncbi:MAG: hypothetical protein DRR16_26150 [Candidatus Parabeggiatoa sp. nov. 3]|nr:MAG: hypothetical protein DRR00_22480 [Gammaproteobacteria bacterium]RKZ59710.1 MAG: hypothetical protein DRQ99_23300 [Gammaproteobacteria bacterium]RKZ79225.1 MAG: hypothetical protein DRR16_26150 [Gammaproteobacteria bacterium]
MILNRKKLEQEIANYTFSDYFKSKISTENLVEFFEYHYKREFINYKLKVDENLNVDDLNQTIHQATKFSKFENEIARREFIVAPILFKLSYLVDIQIHSEEAIYCSENLRGKLDYLIEAKTQFIIIEAKNNDLEIGGFKQLIMELIALDKMLETTQHNFLYGAVTMGTEWGFVLLERKNKMIIRDLTKYIVPDRLKNIVAILLNMLEDNKVY